VGAERFEPEARPSGGIQQAEERMDGPGTPGRANGTRRLLRGAIRSKAAGDAGTAILIQGGETLLRLVSIKVLTTRLTTAEFGEYSFIVSVLGIGYLLFGFELFRYLQRSIHRVPAPERYLAPMLAVELSICLLFTGIAAAFSRELSLLFGLPLTQGMIVSLGVLLCLEIVYVELARLHHLLRNVKLVEFSKLLRTSLLVLLLVLWPELSPQTYIHIALIAMTFGIGPLLQRAGGRVFRKVDNGTRMRARLSEVVSYTWVFLVPAYAYHVLKFGDRFFIAGYLEAAQLGRYHIAHSLQMLCFTFGAGTLAVILHPVIVRRFDEGQPGFLVTAFLIKLAAQTVLSLGLAVLARPLVLLLTSEAYLPAVPVVWLLFPLPMLMLAYGTVTNYLFLAGKRLQFGVNNLVAVLVTIVAYTVLIPRYGIQGAAVATLAGYTTVLIVFGLQLLAGRFGFSFGNDVDRAEARGGAA
jgi:O-antigen/teichoic acid export membrane protein